MDRNNAWRYLYKKIREVALHPEGVDRNICKDFNLFQLRAVALHPEGVDRNKNKAVTTQEMRVSPSTRRAWIEITECINSCLTVLVALHPEGVDRNSYILDYLLKRDGQSPSTRRAWIEITY